MRPLTTDFKAEVYDHNYLVSLPLLSLFIECKDSFLAKKPWNRYRFLEIYCKTHNKKLRGAPPVEKRALAENEAAALEDEAAALDSPNGSKATIQTPVQSERGLTG